MPRPNSPKQHQSLTILKSAAIAVLFLVLGNDMTHGAVHSTSNKFVYAEVESGSGHIGIWTDNSKQKKLPYFPFSYVWFKIGTSIYTNADGPTPSGTTPIGAPTMSKVQDTVVATWSHD